MPQSGWKPNPSASVRCPWTSCAPVSASTSCKIGGKCSENCDAPPKNFHAETRVNWNARAKPTLTYFNNFVRLMQLFPEMHPASLHTAMSMCKNEFISTVDRLLYVRRYRNGQFRQKDVAINNLDKRVQRKVPQVCVSSSRNSVCLDNEKNEGTKQNLSEINRLALGEEQNKLGCCNEGKCESIKEEETQRNSPEDLSQTKKSRL